MEEGGAANTPYPTQNLLPGVAPPAPFGAALPPQPAPPAPPGAVPPISGEVPPAPPGYSAAPQAPPLPPGYNEQAPPYSAGPATYNPPQPSSLPPFDSKAPFNGQPSYQAVGGAPAPPPPPTGAGHMVVVAVDVRRSRMPVQMECPHCKEQIVTRTTQQKSMAQWLIALFICLLGGWVFCLCFIPFCMQSLTDVLHDCPKCGRPIATCKQM